MYLFDHRSRTDVISVLKAAVLAGFSRVLMLVSSSLGQAGCLGWKSRIMGVFFAPVGKRAGDLG